MAEYDYFRQRNYMTPSSGGSWATPSFESKPFTGMQIQGPLPFQQSPQITMPGQQPEEDKDFDMFEKMYNAPTPALEAYKRHIMSSPKRNDYRASKMDRVGAAFAGVSEALHKGGGAGYQAARAVVDEPYMRAVQDYQVQGSGLGELANIESTDMKSKMGYAKTMMDAKREAMKTASEIARDEKLNQLSDAQIAKMKEELKILGKSFEKNVVSGALEIVDMKDGSRQSVGQFALSADQASKQRVGEATDIHRANAGVDLGKAKSLFSFERPQRAEDALRLAEQTSAIGTQAHIARRIADREYPISQGGLDSTVPSQDSIAFGSAVGESVTFHPEWGQFRDENASPTALANRAKNNPDAFAAFTADVARRYTEKISQSQKQPTGGVRTPRVLLPGVAPKVETPKVEIPKVSQNPVNAPSVPETPQRTAAVAQLKADGKEINEETISWMMRKLGQ